ncbi:DUF2730 family protein [Ponticoccus gilvus]|nr:DUF2730 family protein [Enemella evansiae]
MPDLSYLRDLFAILAFPVSILAGIYTFFGNRQKHVDEKIVAVDERCDRHERRLSRLETTVDGLPGKQDLHAIELHMASMKGDLERIDATLVGSRESMTRLLTVTDRLENYLLNNRS